MILTEKELEKLLKIVADEVISPRYALKILGYYFDSELYQKLVDLQKNKYINISTLKEVLKECEYNKLNGCYNESNNFQDIEEIRPEIRKYLFEDDVSEIKL